MFCFCHREIVKHYMELSLNTVFIATGRNPAVRPKLENQSKHFFFSVEHCTVLSQPYPTHPQKGKKNERGKNPVDFGRS